MEKMFAVINYKGNQYLISPDKEYDVDLVNDIDAKEKKIKFDEILLVSDEKKVLIGDPFIKDATVDAEIIKEIKEDKTTTLKFHSKKRYQRTIGSKARKTRIKILKINVKDKK